MAMHDLESSKSLVGHLEDLRTTLLRSLLAMGAGTLLCFIIVSPLFKLLMVPYSTALGLEGLDPASVALQSLNPSDTFMMSMRLALIFGIVLAFPYVIKQLWSFVSPGLQANEKKFVLPTFLVGLLFFLAGTLFAYFIMLPNALHFFRSYSLSMGVTPVWTISNYITFVTSILLVFGIAFELPVVIILLVWLGALSPQTLSAGRKYTIIAILIAAAVLTPPDVVSLLLLTLPMIALFELSIIASKLVVKIKRK